MMRCFPSLLVLITLLLGSCSNEPKQVRSSFEYMPDGTAYQQHIYYNNGDHVIIHFQGNGLSDGTYSRMDAKGKVISKGRYLHGKFQEEYTGQNVHGDLILTIIVCIALVFGLRFFFRYRQAVIDW
jgi:hypothetical protein